MVSGQLDPREIAARSGLGLELMLETIFKIVNLACGKKWKLLQNNVCTKTQYKCWCTNSDTGNRSARAQLRNVSKF